MHSANTPSTGLQVCLSAPDIHGLIGRVEACKDAVGGNPRRITVTGCAESPGKIELTVIFAPAVRRRMH